MPTGRAIRCALLETTPTIVCATLACNTLVCNRATAQAILNGDFDSNLDNWKKDLGGGVLNGNIDAVALLGDALFADGFEIN